MTDKDKNILVDQLKRLDYSIVLLLAATLIEAHNAHDWKELIYELKTVGNQQWAVGMQIKIMIMIMKKRNTINNKQ